MKDKKILEMMSGIDDDLIEETVHYKKTNYIKYIASIAAVCVMFFSAIYFIKERPAEEYAYSTDEPVVVEENKKDSIIFNDLSPSSSDMKIAVEGYFYYDLTTEQIKAIFGDFSLSGIVSYTSKEEKADIFEVNVRNQNTNITISKNEIMDCYQIVGEEKLSTIEGVEVLIGAQTLNNNEVNYYAEFAKDDLYFKLECFGKKEDKEKFLHAIYDLVRIKKIDLSSLEHPIIPRLKDEVLKENELLKEENFGEYMILPKGYVFNSGRRVITQHDDYLYASWSKESGYFEIKIYKLRDKDKARIVKDIKQKELYDLSLYPIPRAETVPESLREIVDNPIFKIEDLNRKILSKRKGNYIVFSTLYGDNIIIEVRGKGLNLEKLLRGLKEKIK